MIDVFTELKKEAVNFELLKHSKIEYLIDNFLVCEAITMFYGKPSQGKSWFLTSLMKELEELEKIKEIVFVDLDNPKTQLSKRNLDIHFQNSPKVTYVSKGDMKMTSDELLELLKNGARQPGQYYKGSVFIIDSTRDFVDNIHNDTQVKRFMQVMKDIRDSGGTVLLIHHATKNGRFIDGSGDFAKSADNIYELKQKARFENVLHFTLRVENDRDPIKNCGFSVDTSTLVLGELDSALSQMSEYEEEFVSKAVEALKKNPDGLNKTEIIESTGHQKSDNTARDTLEKFTDKFWKCEKQKNRFFYTLINL